MSEEPRPIVRTRISSQASREPARRRAPEPPPRPPRVPLLDYRLVVLTNGRPCLRETLESFRERVSPQPLEVLLFDDGGTAREHGGVTAWNSVDWIDLVSTRPLGFCGAVREAWRAAVQTRCEFVMWTEDDFLFERPIDLIPLAEALRANPKLTQMALMRQPVNELEIAAGGCRALRPELYEERDEGAWLQSRTNHSTGCSLMRRAFMAEHPWPDYPENCEGRFSIDLLETGHTFGVWGAGEPWVKHVGRRSGFGY